MCIIDYYFAYNSISYVGKESGQHSKSGATAATVTPSNNWKVCVQAWKSNCTLFELYIFIIIHRVMQLIPRNCH